MPSPRPTYLGWTCTQASPALTAELTLRTLRRRVPPAVPGVFFLSGGQSEEDATVNLDLINRTAAAEDAGRRYPWSMSFSFGRSLQASVLKVCMKEGGWATLPSCWGRSAPLLVLPSQAGVLVELLCLVGVWSCGGRGTGSLRLCRCPSPRMRFSAKPAASGKQQWKSVGVRIYLCRI